MFANTIVQIYKYIANSVYSTLVLCIIEFLCCLIGNNVSALEKGLEGTSTVAYHDVLRLGVAELASPTRAR